MNHVSPGFIKLPEPFGLENCAHAATNGINASPPLKLTIIFSFSETWSELLGLDDLDERRIGSKKWKVLSRPQSKLELVWNKLGPIRLMHVGTSTTFNKLSKVEVHLWEI